MPKPVLRISASLKNWTGIFSNFPARDLNFHGKWGRWDQIKTIASKKDRTLSEEQSINSLWMKKHTDKFQHLSFVHEKKKPFNCEVCDFSIALQNLTWKDMLNWFMKRWNNTHVKFVTTLQNRDRNEKKKPFKFEVSNLCYFYERNYVLFPHSATW